MTDLSNWAPYQILAGPADVYTAPVATAFPAVNAAPGGSWTLVGRTEGGVTVAHNQSIVQLTADQHTGPVKALRESEGQEVNFSFVDLTLENYSLAMNSITVTAAAGPPAIKTINLHRGVQVDLRAILVRGRSPYFNGPAQYQIPVTFQNGSPSVAFVKNDKSVLAASFVALEDLTAGTDAQRFGQLVAQTS